MIKNAFSSTAYMVALILACSSMTVDAASGDSGSGGRHSKKGIKKSQIVHVTNTNVNANVNANLNINGDITVTVDIGTITDALLNDSSNVGSILPFSHKLYAQNDLNNSIGQLSGYAVLIGTQNSSEGRTLTCSWTSSFDGTSGIPFGSVMLAGDLKEYGVSSLAIVGGTGAFSGATGYAEVTPIYRDGEGNILSNVDANHNAGVDFTKTTYEKTLFIR